MDRTGSFPGKGLHGGACVCGGGLRARDDCMGRRAVLGEPHARGRAFLHLDVGELKGALERLKGAVPRFGCPVLPPVCKHLDVVPRYISHIYVVRYRSTDHHEICRGRSFEQYCRVACTAAGANRNVGTQVSS